MINQPPIDELAKKIGSKYALCTVCAKRARQIIEHSQNLGQPETEGSVKPLTQAATEVYEGKLTATKD